MATRALVVATIAALAGGCSEPPAQVPLADCDLNRGACEFPLSAGQTGRIEFTPRPLPLMRPLTVSARVPTNIASARLVFQGVAMDMGFNQATLTRSAAGELTGSAMLPVCATGAMRWRADLYLGDSQTPAARFEFATAATPG